VERVQTELAPEQTGIRPSALTVLEEEHELKATRVEAGHEVKAIHEAEVREIVNREAEAQEMIILKAKANTLSPMN
jgi:hypothetical protein